MPPQKRRGGFEEDDDLESEDPGEGPSSVQSSGRKRRRISDESPERSDSSGDEESVREASTPPSDFDTDDEENLVNVASQAVQKKSRNTTVDNSAAESGILEKVELHNFMCHVDYEYKLGPLINFICGRNGSGKSAILTAIVLCLGGKAAATNRGTSLKNFIREGTDHARIICHIKNQGESAYMPEIYGDSIQVERHFSRNGPSGFKIKNANGKNISTKRADLEDICDHFTLQIENPLNVLSQDQARQFITSSSPSEKYKFFVKGVLLEQLDQDYRLIEEQIDNIQPKVEAATPDVEVMKQRWQVAENLAKASRKHNAWRDKLRDLRRECTWIQVIEQEEHLAELGDNVKLQRETVAEAERRSTAFSEDVVEESSRVAAEAQEKYEQAKAETLRVTDEKKEAAAPERELRGQVSEAQVEMRTAKANVMSSQTLIQKITEDIKVEQERLAEQDGGGAARRQQELEDAKEAVDKAKQDIDDHDKSKTDIHERIATARSEFTKVDEAKRQKAEDVRQQQDRLAQLKERNEVADTVFHPNMTQILADIRREKRFQNTPIGPLGKHVKLLAPEWSSIIEKSFGASLGSFVCLSKHDEQLLRTIFKKYRGPSPSIVLGNSKKLDTSGKEPDEQFQTVMRVLEIDNDYVRNVLIIAQQIENTGLIENQEEASSILFDQKPRNMPRCYCFHPTDRTKGIMLSFRNGRRAQDPVEQWRGPTRMKTNIDAQIRIQEGIVQQAKADLHELERQATSAQNEVTKADQALKRHGREARELTIAFQRAEDEVEKLKEEINKDASKVGRLDALNESLDAEKLNRTTVEGIYMEAQNHFDKLRASHKEANNSLNAFDVQLKELAKAEKSAQIRAQDADKQKQFDLRERNKLLDQLKDHQADLYAIIKKQEAQQTLVAEWIEQATAHCPRVNIPEGENRRSLEAKYDSLKKRLGEAQRKTGDPKEVEAAAAKSLEDYNASRKKVQDLEELREALQDSLLDRRRRWKHFRGHISAAARTQFTFFLSERGFRGEVIIDHKQKMLDIAVEPDITQRDGSGRSARTLSGGEKSFSQICLLLSIWEAMGSPIRCLDEFDVFMDAVNRSTSVSLLIEAARQSPGKQYILISPGTKSDIKSAPDVHSIE
jgi:structural maintenance of chromosomes protein 6